MPQKKSPEKSVLALSLCLWLGVMISCGNGNEKTTVPGIRYFSLGKFIDDEIITLQSQQTGLRKYIKNSGSNETLETANVNWSAELSIFRDADINKPGWLGLYRVDSAETDTAQTILYTALDSSLQIKSLLVILNGPAVQRLIIVSRFRNFYYRSNLYLQYAPATGYLITGEQEIRFASRQSFEIRGSFIRARNSITLLSFDRLVQWKNFLL